MPSQEPVADDGEARDDVEAPEGDLAEGSQNDGSDGGGGGGGNVPRPRLSGAWLGGGGAAFGGEVEGGGLFHSESGEALGGDGDGRCGVVGREGDVDARSCFHPMVPPVGW